MKISPYLQNNRISVSRILTGIQQHTIVSRREFIAMAVVFLFISSTILTSAQASSGSLDPTFGSGGKVITSHPFLADARDIILQPDGKILVAGRGVGPGGMSDFAVARYNPDGSLDTAFGTNGVAIADVAGSDAANAVALQSDGKIVVAGNASDNFGLARFNSNGSLDTSFGTFGVVQTDFFLDVDRANDLVIQPDGKIIAVGSARGIGIGFSDFALARYNSDGSLDSSFGSGGKVTTDFSFSSINFLDAGNAISLQADGKIVVAGTSSNDFALARYNPNGDLDTSFGLNGKVLTDIDFTLDIAFDLVIQPDGKIIAVGSANDDFALVRYNSNGSRDFTFGSTGKVITDFFTRKDAAFAVALQPNGKIVVVGSAIVVVGSSNEDFAVARYNPNGILDPTFGTGGKVTTDILGSSEKAEGVAIQPDGKIVVAGSPGFLLARYLGDNVSQSVDLSITKTASPSTVITGQNITYTITVTNNGQNTAESVIVTDNLPPSTAFISCSATSGNCDGSGSHRTVTLSSLSPGASATITLVARANCSIVNNPTISNTATVSSSAIDPDSRNNSATVTSSVSNPPPVISNATVDKPILQPPNHKMVDVEVNYSVTDNCDPASAIVCTLSVSSNEPVEGAGHNTSPDWEIVDAHHVRLRAERSGPGSGRVYFITITCTDSAGNSSNQVVEVRVPKNKNN